MVSNIHGNLQIIPHVELVDFDPARITVVEGSSGLVPEVLFRLCAASVLSFGRDAVFVDGWNSFNPYALSIIAKSASATPKEVMSRVHVARAFTEYQMETLVSGLRDAIEQWNPAVLVISYLPSLFSSSDGRKLFEPLLECLKSLTASSGVITVITSFGGSWYGDRLLARNADRIIRIEHPKKKITRITCDGNAVEYMPVPDGQTRLTEFGWGDTHGQDSARLSQSA